MVSPTQKFGRSVRVYFQTAVGAVFQLVDWRAGRPVPNPLGNVSLSAHFTIRRSTNPEPHTCELVVPGLSRFRRESILRAYEEAERLSWSQRTAIQAGRVRIDAGYGDDVATLFIGDIAPDGVRDDFTRPGHALTLRALDGRIAWKGRFVNKATGTNVDINTIRQVLAAGGDYMAGKDADASFAKNFPNLVKLKKGFPGYESGYAIFGESRKQNKSLCATLGIAPFFQDGEVRYMSIEAALFDSAVVLTAARGGLLLDASPLGLDRWQARTLMEHRLRPGRQVILSDDLGKPIGAGVFRVEAMVAMGGPRARDFNTIVDLVPTALSGGA